MYKLGLLLSAVLVLSLVQVANAEEIPNVIKSKIRLWALDKVNDDSFVSSLIDLNKRDIIQIPKIRAVQTKYELPKYGDTAFIKINGRVSDYGQTSSVTLIVTRPDGLRTQYTIPVLQSGAYSTSIPIQYDSPIGTYEVSGYHNGMELQSYYFNVQKNSSIPLWIKSTVKLWSAGKINDNEFLHFIQYLLNNKVLEVNVVDSTQVDPGLDVTIHGQKAVRRGSTQDLDIHVENFEGNVPGATVFVRVEDYGENVLEEFKGETDSEGNYSVSYEISKEFNDIKTFLVYVDVTDGISSKTKVFTFQVYCLCGEPGCKCRN
ncbi:MAG: hypothetical protein EB161_02965 [Nitrosopumilaceae archaeon]|nr:hypothetical protein [Nitrosopumilaceae archaeon]